MVAFDIVLRNGAVTLDALLCQEVSGIGFLQECVTHVFLVAKNLVDEVCADWYQSFRGNKKIMIGDLEKVRDQNPQQYEMLKRQGIHSLVAVPLYHDQEIMGFYGACNPPAESLDYALDILQIMGYFITSSLKRRNLVAMLQHMSYTDPLTKVGNRYAMNEYIEKMADGESIGVVFCDVTGLKQVNDTEGHLAGDRLLVQACESLRRVFKGYELFRIGGDEFLALCPRIGEKELEEKVTLLNLDMKERSVVMVIGAVWRRDGKKHIDELLASAEKLMYKEKAAYYRAAGIDRRTSWT